MGECARFQRGPQEHQRRYRPAKRRVSFHASAATRGDEDDEARFRLGRRSRTGRERICHAQVRSAYLETVACSGCRGEEPPDRYLRTIVGKKPEGHVPREKKKSFFVNTSYRQEASNPNVEFRFPMTDFSVGFETEDQIFRTTDLKAVSHAVHVSTNAVHIPIRRYTSPPEENSLITHAVVSKLLFSTEHASPQTLPRLDGSSEKSVWTHCWHMRTMPSLPLKVIVFLGGGQTDISQKFGM